jgi:hypothetical protein
LQRDGAVIERGHRVETRDAGQSRGDIGKVFRLKRADKAGIGAGTGQGRRRWSGRRAGHTALTPATGGQRKRGSQNKQAAWTIDHEILPQTPPKSGNISIYFHLFRRVQNLIIHIGTAKRLAKPAASPQFRHQPN